MPCLVSYPKRASRCERAGFRFFSQSLYCRHGARPRKPVRVNSVNGLVDDKRLVQGFLLPTWACVVERA